MGFGTIILTARYQLDSAFIYVDLIVHHRRLRIDLGLQGPINKKRILEQSQVIFWNKITKNYMAVHGSL